MRKIWTDEQFIAAVKASNTYMEVMRKLGMKTFGANYRTIYKHITRLALDTSHFLSSKERMDMARSKKKQLSNEELFSINNIDRKHVKKNILQQNLIPYQCEKCGISEWQGEKLSLHLDHKNGNNQDNRLENLRFLCPNCHSLTDSYCGKNVRLKNGKLPKTATNCNYCGTAIYWNSKTCRKCSHNNNPACQPKIDWGTIDDLISLIRAAGNFSAAGRKLGVSDNAIRKHLKANNIDPKTVFAS